MSQSKNGGPGSRVGEVVSPPPGMSIKPETGFTPFWEKRSGLLYVADKEAQKIDLSVGRFIRYDSRSVITSNNNTITVAYNLSNF